MISFTLHTKDCSLEERFKLIKDLYQEILIEDPYWHFFYEMEMGDFLRIHDAYREEVEDFLRQYSVEFEVTGEWVETMEFVQRNMKYFREVFHMNSVFAVTYSDDKEYLEKMLTYWIDRYSHSLHDTLSLTLGKEMTKKEALNLSNATLSRSWYDGYRQRYLEAEAHNKKREDVNNNT